MSTNFYRRKKGSTDDGIHICKRTWGWQICFDHNWGVYYQPNKDSLSSFLLEDGYEIVDEYGEILSVEDFWDMVKCHNNITECFRTMKDIPLSGDDMHTGNEDKKRVFETFGIQTDLLDFITPDGLRWNVSSDFS